MLLDFSKSPKKTARKQKRRLSTLTWRILALNLIVVLIPVGGGLYLGEYRRELIEAELNVMTQEGRILAAALGVGAVAQIGSDEIGSQRSSRLMRSLATRLMPRLLQSQLSRAQLFDSDGSKISDSLSLKRGVVRMIDLPPPLFQSSWLPTIRFDVLYQQILDFLSGVQPQTYPAARDSNAQAGEYFEILDAFEGKESQTIRRVSDHEFELSVAVPVQRYKQVLGALRLSRSDHNVRQALGEMNRSVLLISLIGLATTILLSLYIAGTITNPIRRLAKGADQLRLRQDTHTLPLRQGWDQHLPDLSDRQDEIGDLSQALRHLATALEKRMSAIESFAADVSHELKNPLTSLKSAIDTLQNVVERPEQREKLLAIIHQDISRLNRLITDISDASRLDAELARSQLDQVDLYQLVEMVGSLFDDKCQRDREKGLSTPVVKMHLTQASPLISPYIMAHGDRLVQVLQNILENAQSFSPDRAIIDLSLYPDDVSLCWHITICDQGPGIPAGKEEAIFNRFYSERPKQEAFGTHSGLGLSISQQIIHSHGGHIKARNLLDIKGAVTGCCFDITLPAKLAQMDKEIRKTANG